MERRLISIAGAFVAVAVCLAPAGLAHESGHAVSVVIDTDMGLDDAVALAIALQHPSLDVSAMVVTAGAMSADSASTFSQRLLHRFNRADVTLYRAAMPGNARTGAEGYVRRALPGNVPATQQPFSPDAYRLRRGKTTLIALGPMTSLAAALREQPELKSHIQRIIAPGLPDPQRNWNMRADPTAYEAVRSCGIPLHFVTAGECGAKPADWNIGTADYGPGTSIGEMFVRSLLANAETRTHYLEALERLTDELAILYVTQPELFTRKPGPDYVVVPARRDALMAAIRATLGEGRQAQPRVVFVDGALPEEVFRPRIRERRARIIARHGRTEWQAQILMNELHQHLGVYSIVGVKMGLRAAELLNAPPHAIRVCSHTGSRPPVSCLNDGLIVATGATPGRGLFTRGTPCEPAEARAGFTYNGRSATLRLKPEHQQRVRQHIKELLQEYTLEDDAYWHGVEEMALVVWETWHRRDIFEIVDSPRGRLSE